MPKLPIMKSHAGKRNKHVYNLHYIACNIWHRGQISVTKTCFVKIYYVGI